MWLRSVPSGVVGRLGLTGTAAMGNLHVSRFLGSPQSRQPVDLQQAAGMATQHDKDVAETVLHEGLPRVSKHLKVGVRQVPLGVRPCRQARRVPRIP